MRLNNFIEESKMMKNTMVGFGVKTSNLSRLFKYIESWLVRYNIKYTQVKDPHFTIAQITGNYPKDELVREINNIQKNISFNPKRIRLFRGVNVPKDFIALEYKPNDKYVKLFKELSGEYEVREFPEIRPHISLFSVEKEGVSDIFFEDMGRSMPPLPKLKAADIELWNNKFELEYTK